MIYCKLNAHVCCKVINMHKFLIGWKRTLFISRNWKTNGQLTSTPRKRIGSKQKYGHTILLPRTQFQVHLDAEKRIKEDEYLTKKCGFSQLYEWQRKNLPGPDFILHDGPPYANGRLHMGHVINKILKDITLRNHIIHGTRVHYIPGWDCHGLPIELKAIHDINVCDPLEIRQRARKFAEEIITKQKQGFQYWGVTADWNKSGCYFTNQPSYMKNQLLQFINLYDKGIIFRDFMPVHWSSSSRTALAESELEYNNQHQSKSIIVRLRIASFPKQLNLFQDHIVYALIWTTTPWSLIANQAIAFSANDTYCLAKDNEGNFYVISKELLNSVESKIGPLQPIASIEGKELEGTMYFHPLTRKKLPFLAAKHIKMDVGTGLVHIAPAHGQDDFIVAIENNIPILSLVDSEGKYTEAAGMELHGLEVLTKGTNKILDLVSSDILHTETVTHSYPYDWRTKLPVIIRASNQWFIDINSVRAKIIDSIKDMKVYPECNRDTFMNALSHGIKNRPYWCISRQRSWGTPIPIFYSKTTGKILTNRALVERLCHCIDQYGPDCWWKYSEEELIGSDLIKGLNIELDDIEKGNDIMDIWFDSGISWSAVLPEGKANLYLEGCDQFNGWFQSSLITSVALQGCPPYRSLFVHGFAVDENSVKMSKSVGNVMDPEKILLGGSDLQKKSVYGIDVLRWWVANHGCQHTQVPVSNKLFDECKQCIHTLRLILRFLLGVLHPYHESVQHEPQYRIIDKYMLHLLYHYHKKMQEHYDNYKYHVAGQTIMHFVANSVSALYCSLIKDRLYCDEAISPSRIAVIQVAREILTVLLRTIAPIVPHLAEEAWLHYPENTGSVPLHCIAYKVSESWNDPKIVECMDVALELKKNISKYVNDNRWKLSATIMATKDDFALLSLLHDEEQSSVSELCEIMQLFSIRLIEEHNIRETQIQIHTVEKMLCERCKRFSRTPEDDLCLRCANVLLRNSSVCATP